METNRGCYFFLFFFLFFFFSLFQIQLTSSTCNPSDLNALRGFSYGLQSGINGWRFNDSSADCCNWAGVSCDPGISDPRVVELDLFNMSIKGFLSDSLAGLIHLRSLNLSSNSFQGSVPSQLFHLPQLEVLDLSMNSFSGFIPSNNTSLALLQVFNISCNSLHGTHPVLSTSKSLTVFDISGNYFSGQIDMSICNSSARIQILRFSLNSFNGNIPVGLNNCRNLRQLSLDMNEISGSLPDELFELSSLVELNLQSNDLSGPLSSKLSSLANLVHLDLSMNNFSGPIPDVFGSLTNLKFFSLQSNNLVGPLPVSFSSLYNLKTLCLRNNSLSGEIGVIAGMVQLTSLDLGTNSFTGPIPSNLSHCSQLVRVNLARNKFRGEIPVSFKNLVQLSFLRISNNSFSNLSSALEVLENCPNLSYLVLTENFRNGEMMPSANRRIEGFKNLEVLVIAYCSLSGSIPQWIANLTSLKVLDISWNHLDGTIPPWLGNHGSLFYLDVSNNSLTGEIPTSLTEMKSLISINSSCRVSSFLEFPFFVRRNNSSSLQYNHVSSFPPSLILSNNKLVGPILRGFGNLKGLLVLDLHMNALSGPIPDELSEMASLENLDLSYNNLTGKIPPSLTKLNFLANFDVAYNNLSGQIPVGGQFSTFSSTDFVGNPWLCGNHSSSCSPPGNQQVKTSRQKRKGAAIGMAVGIGIGTAFLIGLIYLVVSRIRVAAGQDDLSKVVAHTDELVLLFHNMEQRELTINDILKSTNNFDQAYIIGCGGFGMVYKANLSNGRKAAIKRLSGDFCQMEKEFQAEVETLSRAQHENLVLLQGYCRIGDNRLLIYSYMENGSLDYWLHESNEEGTVLNWDKRLQIAQGAARGLAYLHQSCEPHILHRDIKSSNILLDENFEANLADFGLARLILPQDSHVSTDLVGTLGYIPPEYGQSSVATYKGDVYSFGVVLLELLTSRRPVDMCKPRACRDLRQWVFKMKEKKREAEVFDPRICDEKYDSQMMKVLEIACICVDEFPRQRPSSEQLVKWFDEIRTEE